MSEQSAEMPAEVSLPPVQALIDPTDPEPAPAADEQKAESPAPADDKGETPEQQEAKKQSRFQRRLEAQKSARIQAETEARLLREQIAELKQKSQPPQQASDEPQREAFADYEQYLRAVSRYDAKQEAARILETDRQSRQSSEQERISQDWVKREDSFKKETADYLEVVTPYVDVELGRLSGEARKMLLEAGPSVLYHLAANPDVSDRIAELPPLRQAVEIGKLEESLKTPPAKKASSAPPPLKPVPGGKTSPNGYHEGMSSEEYETWRGTWKRRR